MKRLTKLIAIALCFVISVTVIVNVSATSETPVFTETENLLTNGDFSQYDGSLPLSENRFTGFDIGSKGTYFLNQEQATVDINGRQTTAAKLTYKSIANNKRFATFSTADMSGFSRNKTYRLSALVKLDYADVYENGQWVDGTTFSNGGDGSVAITIGKNNCNVEDYITKSTAVIKERGVWKKLSLIVESEWLSGAWKNYNFKVGICVYKMNCNIYIADMRFEEFYGNIICEDDENILVNGDFEEYNAGTNSFTNWKTYLHDNIRTMSVAEGISGNAMLLTSPDMTTIINATYSAKLKNARSYRVTAFVKPSENDMVGWNYNSYSDGVYMSVSYGDITVESEHIYSCRDWKKLTVDIESLPSDVNDIKVKIYMDYTAGLLYIDDVSITPVLGGTVYSDHINASAGDTVEIEVTPDDGYALLENSVRAEYTDISGNKNTIFPQKVDAIGNVYTFTMPEKADVYIYTAMTVLPRSGDINADGSIDIIDLIRLKKYLVGNTVPVEKGACELDGVTGITAGDLSYHKRMLVTGRSKESIDFDGFEFWNETPLERIAKTDKNTGIKNVLLSGAKGEYESFQTAIANTGDEPLTVTDIVVSDFSDGGKNIIKSDNVTIYREHYVTVQKASPKSGQKLITGGVGEYPDALIPVLDPTTGNRLTGARFTALPFTIEKDTAWPFFIDVYIPRDAIAGDYTAEVNLCTDRGTRSFVVTLTVWDITLSKVQTQGSFFNARTSVNEAKAVEAAKNRIFLGGTTYDLQEKLYNEYGYNNANVGFWSGADIINSTMKAPPTVSEVANKKAKFYQQLNLFAYTADEIGGKTALYDRIIEYAQVLHQGGVKQLITMPPVPELFDDGLGTGRSAVDIWVMLPKQFMASTQNIAAARQKECEIWTYNCLVQDMYSPKFLLDYELINYRIHPGFINYYNDVDGFLYWSVAGYGNLEDPWLRLSDKTTGEVWNGDGILFYPSEDVGITDSFVPSMRAKAIRDGFEDYELCVAVGNLGGNVKDYVKEIATSFSDWTQQGSVLLDNRKILGDSVS